MPSGQGHVPIISGGKISKTIEVLSRLAETGYAPRRIPGDHDAEIADLMSRVQTAEEFSRIAQDLDLATGRILLAFAARTASYAVRVQDATWIRYGLMAAQLDLTQDDPREILVIYSILYRGLELLKVDPVGTFTEVARQATPEIGNVTVGFAQRDEQDKSIAAMDTLRVQMKMDSISFAPGRWPRS